MLSQAFHVRCVGVGALFRGERGARWPAARRRGSRGDGSRLGRDADIGQSGWLLDGFPCTVSQAEALLDDQWSTLRPDAVVLIERQDELVREVALGRRAAATPLPSSTQEGLTLPWPCSLASRRLTRACDGRVPTLAPHRVRQQPGSAGAVGRGCVLRVRRVRRLCVHVTAILDKLLASHVASSLCSKRTPSRTNAKRRAGEKFTS